MAQEKFAAKTAADTTPADFSTDEGALAYANRQVDKLVEAMRYSLAKHMQGLPGDDRELNAHEALRHLLRNVDIAHSTYMEADFTDPALRRMGATTRMQWQLPSPDCMYHSALLHGDYQYRLRGYRGTASIFQTTIFKGQACNLVGWKEISNANNVDVPSYAPGSTIDVVLSRVKPANLGKAHWLELPEGPCEMHIRQYYGDWEKEEPADLTLTCEAQAFPPAPLTRESAETRLNRVTDLLRVHADFYRAAVDFHLKSDPHEAAEMVMPGAFVGTSYFYGHLRCRPDEAVIVEIDKPDCAYWNVTLTNLQWEPGDWWARLSSYNLTQVRPERDGKVRWVASWSDPGVPNWFDVSGRILQLIAFRFFRANKPPTKPRLITVPFAKMHEHFPADTPRVTPEQRRDLMTRRLASVYRRKFGDF